MSEQLPVSVAAVGSPTAATEAAAGGSPAPQAASSTARRRRGRTSRRGHAPVWVALVWLAPALILIGGVVIYPAIELIKASTSRYSITGLRKGSAGARNYSNVLHHEA